MVRIFSPHLEAQKSLRPVVTFYEKRGRTYAGKHKPKNEVQNAPAVVRNQERFSRVQAVIKNFDDTVKDDWKALAAKATCTWKDSATSALLKAYHATNLLPITLLSVVFVIVDTTITATIAVNNIFAEEGFGWGNLGWGLCPWGCPLALYEPEGLAVTAKVQVEWDDILPRGIPTFFGSPKRVIQKIKYPNFHPGTTPVAAFANKEGDVVPVTRIKTQTKDVLIEDKDTLEEAHDVAIATIQAKPYADGGGINSGRCIYDSYEFEGRYNVEIILFRAQYRATIIGVVDPTHWSQFIGLDVPLEWTVQTGTTWPDYIIATDESERHYKIDDEVAQTNSPQAAFDNIFFWLEPDLDTIFPFGRDFREIDSWVDNPDTATAYYNNEFYFATFFWETPAAYPNWQRIAGIPESLPVIGPVRHVAP